MGEVWEAMPEEVKDFTISVVANLVNFNNLIHKIKTLGVDHQYHSDIEVSLKAALTEYSKNEHVRVRTKARLGNVEKTLIPAIAGKDVELTEEQIDFLEIFEKEFANTGYYKFLHHSVTKEIKADTHAIKEILKTSSFVGVDLPQDFYDNLTQEKFDFETIIGGRNDSADLIYNNLKVGKSFDVVSHSEDESIAFILASIKKHNTTDDFNNIYICRNNDGIQCLKKLSKRRTIIIPSYLLVDHKQSILNISYQVIGVNYYTSNVKSNEEIVEIPKYLDYKMTQAIEYEMNKTHDDASIISRKGQGVLSKLFRQIKSHSVRPKWVDQIDIKYSIPTILVGEWHDQDEWQKAYLIELGIINYDEFCQELIKKVAGEGDTFIYVTNGYWRVKDIVESFEILYSKILPRQIEVFKSYAFEVLTDINPYKQLKGLYGFFAFRNGVRANFNEQFKNGIFKALIGIEHLNINDSSARNLKTVKDEIIEGIFSTQDEKQIENIFEYITKYIEAAPERTLDFITQILNYREDIILSIFNNEKQAELLWALEGVSTFPEYFNRVVDILIKLHKIDPGGNLNRPINSLKILLDFRFATNIDSRLRVDAIIKVLNSIPERYNEFLKEILPYNRSGFINQKYKFKFGYKFSLEKQIITWPEYYEIFKELIPHIIEAEVNSERKAIFGLIYCLPKEPRIKFINALIQEQMRLDLDTDFWKELIYYKEYKRTNQQTSKFEEDEESLIDDLISICNKKNAADRRLWIFNQGSYAVIAAENSLDEYNDHGKIEQIITEERKVIVREIFDNSINYFIEFTISNKDPFWVIHSLKDVLSLDDAINTIVFFIKVKHIEAFKYVGNLITYYSKNQGIEWIKNCYNRVETDFPDPAYSVSVLLCCEPSIEIIQFVESNKIVGYFEQLGTLFGFGNLDVKKAYIKSFIDVGRPKEALNIMRFETELYEDQFCIEILEKAATFLPETSFELHVIERIFKKVQKSDFEIPLMTNLEFKYSAYLLAGYPKVGIPNLSKLFFTKPEELIKVINYKNNETDFHKMRFYGNILDNISRFPLSDDDKADKEALMKFINDSRLLVDSPKCEDTLDFIIGGVLSKIPRLNYEAKEYVCELIEEFYSDKLAQGFIYRGRSYNDKSFGNGHFESFKNEIDALKKYTLSIQNTFPNCSIVFKAIMNDLKSSVESLERSDFYDTEGEWIE